MKKGQILSESQFYIVDEIKSNGSVIVIDDNNNKIELSQGYMSVLSSAHDHKDTKQLTKTEMASLFLASSRVAMTVVFMKQVKEADVTAEIINAYEGSTIKTMQAAIKKAVKKGLEGEEREMIGRHYGATDEFGRVHFVDMMITNDKSKSYDTRMRLVDPRTIKSMIVNNVLYTVK